MTGPDDFTSGPLPYPRPLARGEIRAAAASLEAAMTAGDSRALVAHLDALGEDAFHLLMRRRPGLVTLLYTRVPRDTRTEILDVGFDCARHLPGFIRLHAGRKGAPGLLDGIEAVDMNWPLSRPYMDGMPGIDIFGKAILECRARAAPQMAALLRRLAPAMQAARLPHQLLYHGNSPRGPFSGGKGVKIASALFLSGVDLDDSWILREYLDRRLDLFFADIKLLSRASAHERLEFLSREPSLESVLVRSPRAGFFGDRSGDLAGWPGRGLAGLGRRVMPAPGT